MTQQPSLFRKKPVTVQAVQYPCAHPALRRCDCDSNSACSSCGLEYIETLEGCMNVSPGDWIITGVQGEHYPCKPDIFAATYEPADTPPASAQDDAKDEPAITIAAIDEYGPQLHWNKHWVEFGVGAKFYAAPATGDAREDVLLSVLPFLEDMAECEACKSCYKPGALAAMTRRIRAAISAAQQGGA